MGLDKNFWKNKKVFLTGHTGFKGSWLSLILDYLGANIYGYSLRPDKSSLFFNSITKNLFDKEENISKYADVRNSCILNESLKEFDPDIVIHMAAQPLVSEAYFDPIYTYEVNVIGTVNLLSACREVKSIRAILNVTTDKCYQNNEWDWPYREDDVLGGEEPYSNSKACSELITNVFKKSYFSERRIGIATARSGNVVGGGDWSKNRIVPDILRSIEKNKSLFLRNPKSTRPWLYILDSLGGYMQLIQNLYQSPDKFSEAWNFSSSFAEVMNVEEIVDFFQTIDKRLTYKIDQQKKYYEANILELDSSKASKKLKWKSKFDNENTFLNTFRWYQNFLDKKIDPLQFSIQHIKDFYNI